MVLAPGWGAVNVDVDRGGYSRPPLAWRIKNSCRSSLKRFILTHMLIFSNKVNDLFTRQVTKCRHPTMESRSWHTPALINCFHIINGVLYLLNVVNILLAKAPRAGTPAGAATAATPL
jgi:hypothetical protein